MTAPPQIRVPHTSRSLRDVWDIEQSETASPNLHTAKTTKVEAAH